jgi:multisubunit Na+/H+ antiporter MnhG subunit
MTAPEAHPVLVPALLAAAVAVTVVYALGLAVMRDAYQRLHYPGPVVGIAGPLVAAAVWLHDPQAPARIKVTLVVLLLLAANPIIAHATAKAVRLRTLGRWPVRRHERIPLAADPTGAFAGDGPPPGIASDEDDEGPEEEGRPS